MDSGRSCGPILPVPDAIRRIVVNQLVSHPGDGFPGYIRVSFSQGDGHTLAGLADDFEIPDHGILSLAIHQEISLSGRCVFDDVSDGVSNVKKGRCGRPS